MSNNTVIYFTSVLVTLLLIFTLSDKPTIIGYATFATGGEARAVVDTFANDNSMKMLGSGAQICAVVESGNITYYYPLSKSGDSVTVADRYCADPGQDNLIVKFNSYDDLLEFNSNPADFVKNKINTGYYIFPSNYVQAGGDVSCSEAFQKNYCPALYYYMSKSEIAGTALVCCANYELTSEENQKIKDLKGEKIGILEAPIKFLTSTTGIIVIIGLALFIVIISALIMVKPKNPLEDYVNSARGQGFSDDDIKQALADGGWDQNSVENALKPEK